MISPVTLWMLAFLFVPILFILFVSFMSRGTYGGIEYIFTLQNYARFFDSLYLDILLMSILIAGATTLICAIFGYPFAYLIARSSPKYRTLLLFLVIVPFWTNSLIRTYAWIILLRTEGVLNQLLMWLGIISEPLTLLYNNGAILVGLVYTLFPFMVLPLYASIEKLDKSYLEAASDLGAKAWQTFIKITLPLTMPGIVAGSLLVFIPTLGLFFIPDLMGGAKTMMIGNLIKNQFLTARDWPFGAAASIILVILTMVLIFVYLRIAKGDKEDLGVM
ncbi:spermidine/putrescine ABC transporter permease PotB [Fredinandcohnia quinoae]|uniref:Spermidine/putrescine ABC transporter permease PotB n=1 Tax=Fredinandcohnia quinoae TaxID=2918902 RepID=A0AAW5E8S5_9BACI|nr:spermidine/putrescine ABC transporter permease PotB [Fredinandcohnia sp. SECRCQ15]MCH1625781.1 spermidine/putrescine ABC transporter permease PotB [Fredinandcohnia sp. SECRCQ15]